MALTAEAERAEDIGDAFSKFKVAVDDQAAEVTALVSELYAVGSILREIDAASQSPDYGPNFRIIEEDLDLVRTSLTHTLDDVFRILGRIGNGDRLLTTAAYRQTWKDIAYHFQHRSTGRLFSLIKIYRLFLLALCKQLKGIGPEPIQYSRLRHQIRSILEDHNRYPDDLAAEVARISLTPPLPINRHRSYERERPPISPTSPNNAVPPYAPEISSQSTDTRSTSTDASQTSTASSELDHWAKRVFVDDMSTTLLTQTGDASKCFGELMPDARARLQGWEKLLELSFANSSGGILVRLYLREEDNRARILCRWRGRSGGTRYSCLPLNALDVHRDGPALQLCRPILDSYKSEMWARLKFTSMERLVVFHCTLLALRSQDEGRPFENIQDHELEGEQEIFAGQIVDDDFLHALRIYRDRNSRAVRLQASVLHGEMKRTPVWTAFVTNYLRSPRWMTRTGSDIVCLTELRRYIFSSEYVPEQTHRGEHILKFTTDHDAEDFVRTIKDLARLERRY